MVLPKTIGIDVEWANNLLGLRLKVVLRWSLPNFWEESTDLFELQAARMRNYMIKIMNNMDHPYKPKYYKPEAETPKVITADHVARLYGVFIA